MCTLGFSGADNPRSKKFPEVPSRVEVKFFQIFSNFKQISGTSTSGRKPDILDEVNILSGEVRLAPSIRLHYYHQNQIPLSVALDRVLRTLVPKKFR